MYLNNSYFGNGVWGVEDASQKYFGTTAANLTLDEAATLAGMLKGPEIYNPYYSLENATNRRDTVLGAMVDAGKINQDQAAEAKTVGMGNRLADTYVGKSDDYQYPSYFDAVINEAISTYGISEKILLIMVTRSIQNWIKTTRQVCRRPLIMIIYSLSQPMMAALRRLPVLP